MCWSGARSSGYRRPAGRGDTRRAYELYSQWQPKVTILQFVGRVDAEGGFMVCETDNPAGILEVTAELVNYVQYKCIWRLSIQGGRADAQAVRRENAVGA
jgi:hypothetical protein